MKRRKNNKTISFISKLFLNKRQIFFMSLALIFCQSARIIFTKLLNFEIVTNSGLIFDILKDKNSLAAALEILILVIIVFTTRSTKVDKVSNTYVPVIIGASMSNLLERFIYKGVIDYINIPMLSVLNIADLIILISVIYISYLYIKK